MARQLNVVIIACTLALVAGCERTERIQKHAHAREVMGTLANVSAYAADRATARAAVDAAYARLDEVNRLMSDYVDDSEVGQINRLAPGASMVVSPETFAVLERSRDIAQASGGALDITCRPLVSMWKAAGKRNALPTDEQRAEAMKLVGWQKVELDPTTRSVKLAIPGVQIDLGAIAKGYALDLAAKAMRDHDITGGLIDVGGDVRVFGQRGDGKGWHIGIRHPFEDGLYGTLVLTSGAVATSGLQQRFQIIDGKRYSHIVDPRTGQTATEAPSVTVIAPDGATADAWATVFSVLTVEEGTSKAASLDGIEVLWIWRDDAGTIHDTTSDGFDRFLVE